MENVPGLRRVTATINGTDVTLLSAGYLARALGRTGWTVRHWIKLGLLPPAPFVISPDVPRTRRPFFPEQYLDALSEIAWRLRIGQRMDYEKWRTFHFEVARAYRETVVPLLPFRVTAPVVITVDETKVGRVVVVGSCLVAGT